MRKGSTLVKASLLSCFTVSLVVTIAGCELAALGSREKSDSSVQVGQRHLNGDEVQDAPYSRARLLTVAEHVAGAVGSVYNPNNGWWPQLAGTLVSRRHILTIYSTLEFAYPGKFEVSFVQDPAQIFHEVDRKVLESMGAEGRVVLLTLDRDVPPSIVENIPRFNSGQLQDFFRKNRDGEFIQVGFDASTPPSRVVTDRFMGRKS